MEEYEEYEGRWKDIWNSIMPADPSAWSGWIAPHFVNPLKDGNPIFSAVSHQLRRGVRIIEHQDDEGLLRKYDGEQVEFMWWLDEFGEEPTIKELVIGLRWTPASGRLAKEVIKEYVHTGTVSAAYDKYK